MHPLAVNRVTLAVFGAVMKPAIATGVVPPVIHQRVLCQQIHFVGAVIVTTDTTQRRAIQERKIHAKRDKPGVSLTEGSVLVVIV